MSPHYGPFFIRPSLDFPFKGQKQTKKNKCLNIHSTCFAFAQQASPTFPGFPTIDSFSNGEKKVEGEKSRSVDKETLSSATSITGSGGVDNVFLITNANRWWMSCQWPGNGSGNLASHSSAKAETWLNYIIRTDVKLWFTLKSQVGWVDSIYLLTVERVCPSSQWPVL